MGHYCGKDLGGPRRVPSFESGFWALPGHLGVLDVETPVGELSLETSTGCCWWPGGPSPGLGRWNT